MKQIIFFCLYLYLGCGYVWNAWLIASGGRVNPFELFIASTITGFVFFKWMLEEIE